ncbi:glycosyl hydrolase family 28-related protein [Streptomyces sp. MI02-2A]|uniref:glycosyl hydrolase family 28-related protein n=1 Tax=Streptomyces sp. MI02-2A TaxID=3028688 RepID=UPI0029A6B4B4|nr:glycosyl hydrolase family 28-related protein [Streptomyces sp. MI02-2A]MDX3260693.1 glycosyl hydrolase family 28-related protein [Streptomyces sp. MI02-2A]
MTNLVLPFTGQSNWDNTLNTALTALNDGKADKTVINVIQDFGAKGDKITDDTLAIQSALNSALPGQNVLLPGSHATSAPLKIPPQVGLIGMHGAHIDTVTNPTIKPLASFSGAAVILLVDQATGGYSQTSTEQRIQNLTIDCSNLTGNTIDGIQAQGYVHGVYITDVSIQEAPNHGVTAASNASGSAYSWRAMRLHVTSPGGIGINASMTDSHWIDCEVIGGSSHGWFIAGAANSVFSLCKSEWSGLDGFNIGGTGTGQGSGQITFIGCTTDRNKNNGFSFPAAASGSAPIVLIGCTLRRDGSASASSGWAAININGATAPILIDGLSVYPGVNDDGTGINSPQYGISVSNATSVNYASAYLHAATAGFFDGGGNSTVRRGMNIQERTGTTSSPVPQVRGLQTYGTFGDSLDVPGHLAGMASPREYGAIGWSVHPEQVNGGQVLTIGSLYLAAVYVPRNTTATKLFWGTTTAGATPTSGQNFVGLYNSSGTLLVSVNVDARVPVSNGFFTESINVGVSPGVYWVAFLFNAATSPSVMRGPNINASLVNFNLSPASYRFATNGTGTALPATITPGSNTVSGFPLFAALA